jgi:hypothetical protein
LAPDLPILPLSGHVDLPAQLKVERSLTHFAVDDHPGPSTSINSRTAASDRKRPLQPEQYLFD